MNEDVERKIQLANELIDDAWNPDYGDEAKALAARAAQAQATLALVYATVEQTETSRDILAQLQRWDAQGYLEVRTYEGDR